MNELKSYTFAENVGPGIWFTIHLYSFDGEKHFLQKLINHLRKFFPCMECRKHFVRMTDEYKLGDNLSKSVWLMHNMVNERLGKCSPTYHQVCKWYKSLNTLHSDINIKLMKKCSDLEYIGCGMWWILHSLAQHEPILFEYTLQLFINFAPCMNIRTSLLNLELHKFSRNDYPHLIWKLHSSVNEVLGKINVDEEYVLEFFKSDKGCEEGCGATKNKISSNKSTYMGII